MKNSGEFSKLFSFRTSYKKGLSPVIATVLLVALVLVLIVIIFMWSKGFISESVQKGGASAQEVCTKVNLEISAVSMLNGEGHDVQIINRGSIPVYQLEVETTDGGNSVQNTYNVSVDVGGSASFPIYSNSGAKLKIYPVILGTVSGKSSNKAYTCLENGEKIN
jgi:flagellin-like protein